jgi:hypothetical protein
MYGTTHGSGADGVVYKLWPPQTPDMLGVTRAGSAMQVTLAGVGSYHYQLQRSTNSLTITVGPRLMPVMSFFWSSLLKS